MRLAFKLALAVTCAILAVLATNSFILVQRELALIDDDMRRDGRVFGHALAGAVERIWSQIGEPEAIDVVEDANARETHMRVRWVRLDAPPGDPQAPEVPGVEVPLDDAVAVVHRLPGDEVESLYTYFPVRGPTDARVAIELHESLAAEHAHIRETVLHASIATTTLVVLSGLLTLGLGVLFVGRPVRRLVEHARGVGQGDLDRRLDPRQRDELGALAREMNAMTERLAAARDRLEEATAARVAAVEQLRRADRLATVGKLSAGIAHEVGTPLNVITGYAQLIADDAPAATAAHAQVIAAQARRVAEIVRQLLGFARQRPAQIERHDLAGAAASVASLLATIAQKRGVEITCVADGGPVWAMFDPSQLQQVMTNLVVNAVHASPTGATVELHADLRPATPPPAHGGPTGTYACLRVTDRGAGIAPDVLPRIFDPFFTTKDVGEGTGLGLSVAHGIIQEHGGWIEVSSEVGRGTCFQVFLRPEVT